MGEVARSLSEGGNPAARGWMAQVKVWRSRAAVGRGPERSGGMRLKSHSGCRCCRAPSSSSSSGQLRSFREKENSLLFLCPPFFFFTFSTPCSLNPPPFHPSRVPGVVFRSPPAARGRPRGPTEGGEGARNRTPTSRRSSIKTDDTVHTEKTLK